MFKSTNDKVNSGGAVIDKRDVGKRVIVGRVGAGTLLYVGQITGKEGSFCGVELDGPEGKHDGTYQGIAYFHCAPNRGIFAPSYKVELMQEVHVQTKRDEKLVRSAIPTFTGNDMNRSIIAASNSQIMPMDISIDSISSLGSSQSIFDHSLIMSGSWNSDMMMNSQATYTVCESNDRSRYQLLEEIECPSVLIEVDDDITYPPLNMSLVLDESQIGVNRLPVVDDDLRTPVIDAGCPIFPDRRSSSPTIYPSCIENTSPLQANFNIPEFADLGNIPSTSPVLDRQSSQTSIDSTMSYDAMSPQHNSIHTNSTEEISHENDRKSAMNRSFTIVKSPSKEPIQQIINEITEKDALKKEEKKERPKKQRPPSIRELQNAPTPSRPAKVKPPSKSQLMMEQLKASIEADKLKPKKAVKSKLSALIVPSLPVKHQPTTADENEGPNTVTAAKNIDKPKTNDAIKKTENEQLSRFCPKTALVQPSSMLQKSKLVRPSVSSSSSAQHLPQVRRVMNSKPSTSVSNANHQINEALKVKRYRELLRAFDALTITLKHLTVKGDDKLCNAFEQNDELESQLHLLENDYEQVLSMLREEHTRQLENINHQHEEELRSIKLRYEKQLDEGKEELAQALDEQQCLHEAEIERLSRSNQIQCANLDSKLAEAEKNVEELIRDKKNLEATLSKDTNEKVAELSKEISSLNTALEMKSTEMKELRHINAKFQLKIEEIQPKDIEINKLKHRIRELKQLVDQKTNTEKALMNKYDELQRSVRSQALTSESVSKENDILRYKIEEMESSTSEGEHNSTKLEAKSIYCTPQTSNFRKSRMYQSERRTPTHSMDFSRSAVFCSDRNKQSCEKLMNQSVVSLYLEQGRNRASKTNVDTIYTPEGTFIAKGRGPTRRLSFDDINDADDEGSARLLQSNDGTTSNNNHAVTDSGISV